ncbi:protein of unknown function [Burkholderia multivorans]
MDKQLQGAHAPHAVFPRISPQSVKNSRQIRRFVHFFAFLPGFLQVGPGHGPRRDCLSNRLRKTCRAFLQAPAFEPTCAIEHFFHT